MNDQSHSIAFDQQSDEQSNCEIVLAPPPEDTDKRFQDGPWAQKFMHGSDKKLAIQAAERARMRMTEWLGEAIRGKVALEREDREIEVLPPAGQTPAPYQSNLTVDDIDRIVTLGARIAEMQGRPLAPGSHILVGAKRRLIRMLIE